MPVDPLDCVNRRQNECQLACLLAALQKCIERGMPYRSELQQHATAEQLGLEGGDHRKQSP